jgi:hypothetical protein
MPALSAALEREVERLWQAARARVGGLFNGRAFSTDRISPTLIEGHWTEYRRIVARMERPDLAPELPLSPTATGGVVLGGTGDDAFVLFGRRPVGAVYQAGEWQLPPAGSLDPSCAEGEWLDPVRQLRVELAEETGLPGQAVRDPRPLCLVEHPGSGILDFGIAVRTDWSADAILAAHARAGNGEYDPLLAVALRDLPAFLARHEGQVTRQAPAFLRRAGVLAG